MHQEIIAVSTSDGPMAIHCYLPSKEAKTPLPAVILLQEAFGVNAHIKRYCERITKLGYAVFAPELFHRNGQGIEFGYTEFPKILPILSQLTNANIAEDLKATYNFIISQTTVDNKNIAAWGFCMGGFASILAACEIPIKTALSFYGGGLVKSRANIGFSPLINRLEPVQCPLLLVFGGLDAGIPKEDTDALETRLISLGKPHKVVIYPEAGHGFCCEDRSAYHESSAEAAWLCASQWLNEQFI
jgi:carboxymethylenebutenolidase